MKRYPIDYSKTELTELINSYFERLANELLSDGEKSALISKIQIGQLQQNTIEANQNYIKLNEILRNNQKSSKSTSYLSLLMIILAIATLVSPFIAKEIIYTDKFDSIIQNQNKINEEFEKTNLIIKDYLIQTKTTTDEKKQ